MLQLAKIPSTYIYSSLDQAARKINVAKFQFRKVRVMIVTDLAARGIDIPLLDNVINFHFPAKPKLFVHRVGKFTNIPEAYRNCLKIYGKYAVFTINIETS